MSDEFSNEDLALVHELIAQVRLVSMDTYELSARRSEPMGSLPAGEGSISVDVASHIEARTFGFRITANIALPLGEVVASIAGEYELTGETEPSRRTVQLFGNEVAIMTIYPYVREAVSTITGKVFGEPLFMPVTERGQIRGPVEA